MLPLFLRTTAALLRKEGFRLHDRAEWLCGIGGTFARAFDLVLSDLNMPGNMKLELLRTGRTNWPDIPLIVVTGAPSLPTAIESVRLGITDYLLKPVKFEDLLSSVRRALAHRKQPRPRVQTRNDVHRAGPLFPEIIGESPPMMELFEIMERVADTDTNILITGESGTGKEAVAKAIHRRSRRSDGDFSNNRLHCYSRYAF